MAKPLSICDSGCGYSSRSRVNTGGFILTQSAYHTAVKRISSSIEFGYSAFQEEKSMNNRIYWAAVSYIYQHRQVSASEIIESMRKHQTMIPSCTRVTDQLKYIDDAYNRDVRRASDKIFLATDFQRRLYLDEEVEL